MASSSKQDTLQRVPSNAHVEEGLALPNAYHPHAHTHGEHVVNEAILSSWLNMCHNIYTFNGAPCKQTCAQVRVLKTFLIMKIIEVWLSFVCLRISQLLSLLFVFLVLALPSSFTTSSSTV